MVKRRQKLPASSEKPTNDTITNVTAILCDQYFNYYKTWVYWIWKNYNLHFHISTHAPALYQLLNMAVHKPQ